MSEFRVAYIEALHVTATSSTALTDATKVTGLKTFNPSIATTWQELKHLNSPDGFSRWVAVWASGSCTLAGECDKGSTTQAVLVNALKNRTSFFVHCIDNPSATVGMRKGDRYELVIESGDAPHEAGALVTFNYPCKMQGAPVEILAV